MNISKFVVNATLGATLTFWLAGCGSSGDGTTTTDIEVERGKIYDANVTDSSTPPQVADYTVGENTYKFKKEPTYPVTASGGWIDVDGDGNMTTADVINDLNLTSYSKVITPITTYLGDTSKPEGKAKLEKVITQMGVSKDELFKVPSKASPKSMLVANAIYQKVKEADSTNVKALDFNGIKSTFDNLKGLLTTHQGKSGAELAKAIELQVVNTNLSGHITKLDTAKLAEFKADRKKHKEAAAKKNKKPSADGSTTSSGGDEGFTGKRYVVDEAKGTVYDQKTKITWQNDHDLTTDDDSYMVWTCGVSTKAGYSDWRVPTQAQLQEFHRGMNKQGDVPVEFHYTGQPTVCKADVGIGGNVKTKYGAENGAGGKAGDKYPEWTTIGTLRCIRGGTPEVSSGIGIEKHTRAIAQHNKYRHIKYLQNSLEDSNLKVNSDLVTKAQAWASKLAKEGKRGHDTVGNAADKTGENIYYSSSTAEPTYEQAVKKWLDEEKDYTYSSNTCASGKECGHYTQVLWHATTELGCAKAQFKSGTTIAGHDFSKGWVVVCKYKSAGNVVGQKPY